MQLITVTVILICLCNYLSYSNAQYPKKYLVFGGNGLLGSEIVSLLRLKKSDVTIVNRGNWYWDSSTRIKPFVNHVQCDRYTIKSCTELTETIKEKGYFDIVYDFSSYIPSHLQDVLDILRMRVGRYVYISSDSVYEVCKPSEHGGPTKESDAIRFENFDEIRGTPEYDLYDHYGDVKLGCEEVLRKEHNHYQLNYISLRLPDVIGPRDNSDRFWIYFLWVKFQDVIDRPVYFPPRLHNQQLSFVFSENVAMLLLSLDNLQLDILNQAYNVAFKETATLKEFIIILGKNIQIPDVKFDETTVKNANTYYPSVKRGPLNVTKAEKLLKWKPHSLSEGIKRTADFYNYAMTASEFKKQRDGIVEAFIPDDKLELFKKRYKEIYGKDLNMRTFHNEL